MQNNFREIINYRAGVEIALPKILSFGMNYFCVVVIVILHHLLKNDPKEYNQENISVGLGMYFDQDVSFDLAIVNGNWKTYHNNYSIRGMVDPSRTNETITTSILNFTLTYRF